MSSRREPIFPLAFLILHLWGLYNMAATNVDPVRPDLWVTLVFPLLWIWATLVRRALLHQGRKRLAILLACPLVIVVPVLSRISPAFPLTECTLRRMFEWSTLFWVILLAAHCAWTYGKFQTLKFFGLGIVYGSLLENAGVFMGCFSEEGYQIYLPFLWTPLATMMGWSASFYVSIQLATLLAPAARLWWLRALFATGISLSLDAQLDPVAVINRWWVWESSLCPWWFGVPVLNYVAWLYACLVFYLAYEWIFFRYPEGKAIRILAWSLVPLSGVAFAGVLATMALIEGLHGPSLLIFRSFFSALLG